MLNFIQVEFRKLRRKKSIYLFFLSAFLMPFFTFLYFHYLGKRNIEPALFYRWSAFGFPMFVMLPFVLGLLSAMLMHDENGQGIRNQLWLVPVSKMGYFFSKFTVVVLYGACFMLLVAIGSVLFSVLPGYTAFTWESVLFLLEKCLEIAGLISLAMLPVFSAAVSQKGYVLPVALTLIYIFAGMLLTPVNTCLHPIASAAALIARNGDIPGIASSPEKCSMAVLCMVLWSFGSVIFAGIKLNCKK